MNALSPGTLPGSHGRDEDCDPHIEVSACTIGEAAEVLALVAGAAAAEPAIGAALARFLAGKGADPAHAMSWLVTRAGVLAAELDGALAFEGISTGPGLDRYRGAGARW
jgi:hypothetical protein